MTGRHGRCLAAGLPAIALLLQLGACEPAARDPRLPLSPLAVPATPIEQALGSIYGVPVASADDLRQLLKLPEHVAADRIIAYAPYRRDSDFTDAGVLDPVLRVRMGRMSRDSLEVAQAVVVTQQGEILDRFVISSIPQSTATGVLVVTR
ncbi:MAG TPA: hypothetical protein VFY71_04790 [Planctomycetota bacterium]|nr:hypothetical protein [Planctomycetota bacterium]